MLGLPKPDMPSWTKMNNKIVAQQFNYDWDYFSREMLKRDLYTGLRWRLDNDLVNFCLLSGISGAGKSNISFEICKQLDQSWNDNFRQMLKTNFYLGKDTILDLDYITNRHAFGEWVVIDEIELVLERSGTTQVKEGKKTLDMIRDAGVNFIFTAVNKKSISQYVIDHQINYDIRVHTRYKDKRKLIALIRANCTSKDGEAFGYVNINDQWFDYMNSNDFEFYQKIKKDKLYSSNYRKNYKENKADFVKQDEENKDIDVMQSWLDIINKDLNSIDIAKRDSDTVDMKVNMIIPALELGIEKKKIKGLLGCGDNLIGRAEALLLKHKAEQRESEG